MSKFIFNLLYQIGYFINNKLLDLICVVLTLWVIYIFYSFFENKIYNKKFSELLPIILIMIFFVVIDIFWWYILFYNNRK